MKNIAEVIEMKEREILRVRKEVEALRIAAPLLGDETPSNGDRSSGPQPVIERP